LSEQSRAFELHDYDAGMQLLPMRDNLFAASGADYNHDHDHGDLDPHIWLSTANARVFVDFVATRLAELDPQSRRLYLSNAEDTVARLEALADSLNERLKLSRNTPYIVFHDGFQYFDENQNLNGLGALVLNPDIPPGPRTVSQLRDLAAPLDRVCLFQEPQFSERWLSPLADGLEQATLGVIDPMGSLSEPGPGLYADMMVRLADDLAACLGEQ
jgi:zinc transport system substrate-binding protein